MLNTIPRPEHPNPQWMRKEFTCLNGEWEFYIDKENSGLDKHLETADSLPLRITVPFCPESSLSGIRETDFMRAVWYKRKLFIKKDELSGRRIILHFGAADFETRIWINGNAVGFPHIGGYGSFEYDITDYLSPGENTLTVRCYDDTRSGNQSSGKQSPFYYSLECFYTRTTGIWQTVWYESVPENYVKYCKIITDPNAPSVSLILDLSGEDSLDVKVFYCGREVGVASKNNAASTVAIEIPLTERHLWDLGEGNLYTVNIRFGLDEVETYFGLRTIKLENGKFFLNGRSVFQRLVLDQGFYHDGICTASTDGALEKDIKISMAAGFNGARLHEKVFEPRFLYHADRLGYMVWGEYGSWGLDHSDISSLASILPDWISVIRRDINHPSVIGWCPFNETWDFGEQKKRQNNDLLRIIYETTKLLDPTRPCIDTSGAFHVITDIYDVHDYNQDPEELRSHYENARAVGKIFDRLSPRQSWDGKAPLFVSEYGGISYKLASENDRKSSWGYGNTALSADEFYERYKALTHALLDNPDIMGFCYTQLTDIEQEQNGLFSYETREPKLDLTIIREINTKKAAIEE